MKTNMGLVDRVIRLAIAVVIAIFYFTGVLQGTLAIILAIVSIIFLATGLIGICPLYLLFKISTKKKTHDKE